MRLLTVLLSTGLADTIILKFDGHLRPDCRGVNLRGYAESTARDVAKELGAEVTAEALTALDNIIVKVEDPTVSDSTFARSVLKHFKCVEYAEIVVPRYVLNTIPDCSTAAK